jgi:RimJ/RimL family protein N-acetyltransferase/acyl carrier protein
MTAATLAGDSVITFDEFLDVIRDELGCELGNRTAEAALVDDLGWDSLALFEVVGLFDRHGLELPEELLPALRTLGDLHHYFAALSSQTATIPSLDRAPTARPMLVVPTQADFEYLFRLHADGDHLVRYRLRATTPSPDSFHRLLWDGVVAQFLVKARSHEPVGLVSCFGADFRNRHAHIGVLADPEWHDSGLLVAGAWQFIGYLFEQFDLRKLYAEVLESNYRRLATGAGRLFEVEGRLSNHEYVAGAYEDLYVLALDRDRWGEQQHRLTWRRPS